METLALWTRSVTISSSAKESFGKPNPTLLGCNQSRALMNFEPAEPYEPGTVGAGFLQGTANFFEKYRISLIYTLPLGIYLGTSSSKEGGAP
jgi:hypothetical protein